MSTYEAEVRDYLRGRDEVMSLLNGDVRRLNLEWSGNTSATHVTVHRAGGSILDYVPIDAPAVVLSCYGSTRPAAAELAGLIAHAMREVSMRDLPLCSAAVESMNWLPTAAGVPRYVVSTVVTARFTPSAA